MTDQENEIKWREYFYPGTDVLINNYGIKDIDRLKEAEATCSFDRLVELQAKPLDMDCGKKHLIALHRYIFEDIYPFAGKYRAVNMIRDNGNFLVFNKQTDIDRYLDETFEDVENRLKNCSSKYAFADIIADLYGQLIYCHPFREGNGRTIREFIREFSIIKSRELPIENVELDWRVIDKEKLDEFVEITHSFASSTMPFYNALVPVGKTK